MKEKKVITILFFIVTFLSTGQIEALGKQDTSEYQDVDGSENWQKTINISNAEPGEYNLVVKGVDSAGNVGYAGPYNLMVDPDSSIPGVSISYPLSGEKLGADFSVVGVAWDDDKVEKVELAIDNGEFESVRGTNYWSWHYERKTAKQDIADGPHILRVRSLDIDGIISPEVNVEVNIDTAAPDFTIESFEEGTIVSGKIEITGTVEDENGLESAAVSFGDEPEEEKLSLKKEKDSHIYRFSHKIDTRDLEDGPRLITLKATDETGSQGSHAFLLFVDNTAPEISFLYPAEEEVNGIFTIVGRAEDAVGIEALTFRADNGQEGEIALHPGNTLWMHNFDYAGVKSGKKKITFHLSDTAGNTVKKELSFQLNSEADLPRVFSSEYIGEPLTFEGTPRFSGWTEDDDGPVSAVEYMIEDLSDWKKMDSTGPWSLELMDFTAREGVLKVRAVDGNGTTGEELAIPFTKLHPPGKIMLEDLVVGEQAPAPWYAGRVFAHGEKVVLQGTLKAAYPKSELYYLFDGGEERKTSLDWNDEQNLARFSINLPAKETAGRHDLHLRLLAPRQREVTAATAWYREAPADENGTIPPLVPEEDLIFISPGENTLPGLYEGMQLQGWIPEGKISSIHLDPETDALRIEKEGRFFSLFPTEETVIPRTSLEVESESGKKYSFTLPGLVSDATAPTIFLENPEAFDRVKDSVLLSGEVSDTDEVRKLECTLSNPDEEDSSPWQIDFKLEAVPGKKGSYRFEQEIKLPLEGRTGPVQFKFRATDAAGNTGTDLFTLLQDSKAPEFELLVPKGVSPSNSDWANEQTVICGYIHDGSEVSSVLVGEKPFPVEDGFFSGQVNFSNMEILPESIILQVQDRMDNRNEVELPLVLDTDSWKPEVRIHVPAEDSAFTEAFKLSGSAVDREGLERIEYRINGGEWRPHSVENTFSIPISLSELGGDLNSITVRAVDINGYTSDEVERKFRVSLQEPEISVTEPTLEEVIRGTVELKGQAEDENGIELVEISFDNGNSFQKALVQESAVEESSGVEHTDGQSEWSYRLDSKLLANGTNSILLHVKDGAGVSSYYSTLLNVDNTPPELEVRSPAAGEVFYHYIHLEGRVHDSVGVESIKVRLTNVATQPVEVQADEAPPEEKTAGGGGTLFEQEYSETGVLLKDIDISDLPRGTYLFSIEVRDGAGNKTVLSKSIELESPQPRAPDFILPLPGEEPGPFFTMEGRVPVVNLENIGENETKRVSLLVDGDVHSLIDVEDDGRFHTHIGPDDELSQGVHQLALRWEHGGTQVESEAIEIRYRKEGLWITTDSIHSGEHVGDLFMITGSSGYLETPPREFESQKQEKEYHHALEDKKPTRIEISFDEGRSFQPARGEEDWSYRIYRQNHPEGEVRALLRAVSKDETAYTRLIFIVDTTPPQIALYEKIEDGRFNESLYISGHAFDESGLSDLKISLRPGDKNSYSTPSFIQGMYFDATAMGATWFTSGLGMTFMDDNVKLQVQYGYAPEGYTDPETGVFRTARFGGQVLGSKLLANILYLPYDYFLGPKFQQLSASFALGANFSYFNNPGADSETSWGVILAGVVTQLEFVKYEFRDRSFLKYISAFAEGQLWLISSDVEPDIAFMPSFGLRVGLF